MMNCNSFLKNESRLALTERIYTCHSIVWESELEVIMRESVRTLIVLICSILTLAGCQIAGGIFKAGMWVGAALVIGIIALIVWFVSKA